MHTQKMKNENLTRAHSEAEKAERALVQYLHQFLHGKKRGALIRTYVSISNVLGGARMTC